MKGFSTRNLKYMRKFAEEYPDKEFVQQLVAQLPWGHNIFLMDLVPNQKTRLFYIQKAIEHGWSRNVMVMQIETGLSERQGKAISNFSQKLPKLQSDLAINTLKDPYVFDFLGVGEEAQERETETALMNHMQKFLLELGAGFAFVGRQYHISVGDEDFYIDLLFYHLKLRRYVVVELKAKPFRPEHLGKMSFYLEVVDDVLRHKGDKPSIGILLCKTKNNVIAEYALRTAKNPIGLSEYSLAKSLPEPLETSLPSIEELEAELSKDFE